MVKKKIVDCDKEIEFTPKSFSGSASSKFGVYYNDKDRTMKSPRNGRYFHDVNISNNTSPALNKKMIIIDLLIRTNSYFLFIIF